MLGLLALLAAAGEVPRSSPPSPISGLPTDADYPNEARRVRAQGTTRYRLEINQDGRANGCTVTASSGSTDLDAAGCRKFIAKSLWLPGKDTDGRAVASSFSTAIRWQMPKPAPAKAGSLTYSATRGADGRPFECRIEPEGGAPAPPAALNTCVLWTAQTPSGGYSDVAVFFREYRQGQSLRFALKQQQLNFEGTLPPTARDERHRIVVLRNEETLACVMMTRDAGPLVPGSLFSNCTVAADAAALGEAAGAGVRTLIVATLSVLPTTSLPTPSD